MRVQEFAYITFHCIYPVPYFRFTHSPLKRSFQDLYSGIKCAWGCYSKYRRFDHVKLKWLPPQAVRGRPISVFQLYIVMASFRMVNDAGKVVSQTSDRWRWCHSPFLTNFGVFEKWCQNSSVFTKNVWFHPKMMEIPQNGKYYLNLEAIWQNIFNYTNAIAIITKEM